MTHGERTPHSSAESGPPPASSIVLYQTEDGRSRIECRFEGETIWLTQALMAELYQKKDVRTVNEHLANIFDEGELDREATIRKFRIVRREGAREVAREIEHYALPAILAVGYRVRSPRGTQFRQWATVRLSEFLVKGFTMEDERLKNPPGPGVPDNFDKLLERIRDTGPVRGGCICACARFSPWRPTMCPAHRRLRCSPDGAEQSALCGDGEDRAGTDCRASERRQAEDGADQLEREVVRKGDATIAKNDLSAEEIDGLNLIVVMSSNMRKIRPGGVNRCTCGR